MNRVSSSDTQLSPSLRKAVQWLPHAEVGTLPMLQQQNLYDGLSRCGRVLFSLCWEVSGHWLPTSACALGPVLRTCPLDSWQMFKETKGRFTSRRSCVSRLPDAAAEAPFLINVRASPPPSRTGGMAPPATTRLGTARPRAAPRLPPPPAAGTQALGTDGRERGLNSPSGLGWFQNPKCLFCTL